MDDEDEEDIDDNLEENDDDDSVSDFDDDEDPDKIDIPVAVDFAATSGNSNDAGSSSTVPPKPDPASVAPVNSGYANGKPMLSTMGLPILPVNTATTRVGGPTVARRGGTAGQPFTSEYLTEYS